MAFDELEEFDDLMQRVHAGDAEAAAELVTRFEPEIRREVRIRLTDSQLRRVVDSIDICQSVLGNFFVRAALGQFNIEHPNQLFRLLTTMARNKIIDRHRSEQVRRNAHQGYSPDRSYDTSGEPLDRTTGPDSVIQSRELLEDVVSKLKDDEKQIAMLRQEGKSWNEVAEEIGSNAQALRKKLSRACNRIMGQLPE